MNKQEIAPSNNLSCPHCQLSYLKKNGQTYYGIQNYQCLLCDRQFVVRNKTVASDKKEIIENVKEIV